MCHQSNVYNPFVKVRFESNKHSQKQRSKHALGVLFFNKKNYLKIVMSKSVNDYDYFYLKNTFSLF